MQDAWRAYLELALGLTDASRKRAQAAVRKVVGSSGATAAQLQTMAEELVSTGMANREALTRIVRSEVERALGVLGLASSDEVAVLTKRVRRLERDLAAATAGAARPAMTGAAETGPGTGALAATALARQAVAKKTVAKKAAAKQAVAKKAVAKKAVTKKTTLRKGPVTRTTASGDAE